jgi:hypothetical protein
MKDDLELLNSQVYKEYFYNCIYKNWKITSVKVFVAFLFSFLFDLFDLFVGYNFFISYVLIEVLYFNLINKDILHP